MFQYEHLIYTPAFYFLIALTLALTFGYTFGRKWNRRILMNALDPLLTILKARDQQFTNIGGQTGFHATIVPGNMRTVRRVDVTVTLLPRQSWLYMPFSYVVRKSDRFQAIFYLNKRGRNLASEAHLVDVRVEKRMGNHIENAEHLTREEIDWGGRRFHLYSADSTARRWMTELQERLGDPATVHHVAVLPEQERVYLFMVPKVGTVPAVTTVLRDWIEAIATPASADAD